MSITQYAVRAVPTLNNTGKQLWEEPMHHGHHTVCSRGATYLAQYKDATVGGGIA